MTVKSQLDGPTGKSALTEEEMFRLAKAAWHLRHVLTVPMAQGGVTIDDWHRQALENVGNKLYGARGK